MGIFNGQLLFDLKSTYGLPLDMALDRIINDCHHDIDWPAFIEGARDNGWWDFQTFDLLNYSFEDACLPMKIKNDIIFLFKSYVIDHPHPLSILKEISCDSQ